MRVELTKLSIEEQDLGTVGWETYTYRIAYNKVIIGTIYKWSRKGMYRYRPRFGLETVTLETGNRTIAVKEAIRLYIKSSEKVIDDVIDKETKDYNDNLL